MYPFIEIFGQTIPTYGLMLMIGFFSGLLVVLPRHKVFNLDMTETFIGYIMAGIGAFIGGKAFYVIQGIPWFLEQHAENGLSFIQYIEQAGLVYYGGFIGCILFVALFCVIFKIPFWEILDTLLPALPLAQAFGRIGCFMVGCCYGVEHEHGIAFSNALYAPNHVPLLPIQLIESACVLGIFVAMMLYGNKKTQPGKMLGLYMICYAITRFMLEFFRGDAVRGITNGLSTSQWVSIFVLIGGIIFFFFYKQRNGSRYKKDPPENLEQINLS